ncbi:hypothetical protein Tco_1010728 [Tanacetum coccineum]
MDDPDNLRAAVPADAAPDNDNRFLTDPTVDFFSGAPFLPVPNGLGLGLRLGLLFWVGVGITDLVLVDLGELTRGEETRGEETRSSLNEEFEMLCLRFRGDAVGSFMLLGLDGATRRADDGVRGDDMEGDLSSFLLTSPTDDERVSFNGCGCCSLSSGLWDSHGRAAIHRSNQLQPHCGLFGSMNVGFADFVWFLHICCVYQNNWPVRRQHII